MSQQLQDDLQGQRLKRIEKVNQLRDLGIDPYPARTKKEYDNQYILDNFEKLNGQKTCLAGRIVKWREHGKVIFADILDQTCKIQFYIRQDLIQEDLSNGYLGWDKLYLIDTADFVEVCGTITKTKTGEISLEVEKIKILTKALRGIPSELADKEQKFRRRYLDLILNSESQKLFKRKAAFFKANRDFLISKGFIEVDIPVLEHVTGGADARPFVTHHNDLDQDFFLRISTELNQKRLIGGGYEKIFTIGPNFRNEGLSDEHLQEYQQIEWYWAYADYRKNMELVRDLYRYIAQTVYNKSQFTTRGHTFDLQAEWQEIDYVQIIKDRFDIDIFTSSDEQILNIVKENNIKLDGAINRNRLIDNLWKLIRKTISGPAFLLNEPKFMSPLAKSKLEDTRLTERFHVILAGSELGNGYSEINDPQDQLQRFVEQQKLREGGDDEAQMMDIDFIEMLEYGMPPTSGWGHSERLFWFLENVTAREGTLFPQLKFELANTTKKIYTDLLKYIDIHPKSSLKILDNPKKMAIDPEFKQKFPSIVVGYAEINNVKIDKTHPQLEKMKLELLSQFKDKNTEWLNELSEIKAYRQLYKETGVDWHSRRPSPEALLRRVLQGKGLYTINSCVDAYNLIVMKYRISIGAFDADNLKPPVVLKQADGGEKIRLIMDDADTVLNHDEVAYFDQLGPYNLNFNYRDSDRTKVTEQTTNLIINVDGVYDADREKVERSLQEAVKLIQKFCGGEVGEMGIVV